MNPCETAAAVTALAVLIHQNLSEEAAAYLSAIFVSLGDQLALLAAAEACCRKAEECCKKTEECPQSEECPRQTEACGKQKE
ncbi:MAG TPA: hypothetical protein PKI76_02785 [Oscillospiraceae bacterium]|nr:hypothetical protein [Oscillospiraceae bacterium]HNW04295.1 hypothetical protein [Oscillospiraceae bacterium]